MKFLEIVLRLTKEYFKSVVIAILFVAACVPFMLPQYNEFRKDKDQVAIDARKLADDKSLFEKERASALVDQAERKAKLDVQENGIKMREVELAKEEKGFQEQVAQVASAKGELSKGLGMLSREQHMKDAQEKIEKVMADFTAMGVDLDERVKCDDVTGRARYNAAEQKYRYALTLADASGLTGKYRQFFVRMGAGNFCVN